MAGNDFEVATPNDVGRRTVLKGAAWSLPVIAAAVAAPLASASPLVCTPYTVKWNSNEYVRHSATSGTFTNAGGAFTIQVASRFYGDTVADTYGTAANLKVWPSGTGSIRESLSLVQSNNFEGQKRNGRQEVTFTFSQEVTDLTFAITDIDANYGDYIDAVELHSTAEWEATTELGARGAGLTGNEWRREQMPENEVAGVWGFDENSGQGRANITFLEPVTSFTLVYFDLRTKHWSTSMDHDQLILIHPFSFEICK